jgi:hypothetical protein
MSSNIGRTQDPKLSIKGHFIGPRKFDPIYFRLTRNLRFFHSIVLTMTNEPIAVDLNDHSDEDYESGAESATTSLSSTIFDYEYENGRRYHGYKAGAYAIPNDETEQERFVAAKP